MGLFQGGPLRNLFKQFLEIKTLMIGNDEKVALLAIPDVIGHYDIKDLRHVDIIMHCRELSQHLYLSNNCL